MKTLLISLSLTIALWSACNTTKPASNPEVKSEVKPATEVTKPVETPKKEQLCRLNVSFISIGEGTDPKAKETLDLALKNWEERFSKSFQKESIPWGREGETDFCFQLEELTAEEQGIFVDEIKTIFEGNNLVQISENQPSRFKK